MFDFETTYTGTGTTNTDYNSCGYRLPCGLCRFTNTICPIQCRTTITPTWNQKWDVTCSTDKKGQNV